MISMERNLIMYSLIDKYNNIKLGDFHNHLPYLISIYESRQLDPDVQYYPGSLNLNKPRYMINLYNDLSLLVGESYISVRIKETRSDVTIREDADNRLILYNHLKRCYINNCHLLRILSNLDINLNRNDILSRIEEFDIIKDYKIDLISLNTLYDFYNKPFNIEEWKTTQS